MEAPQLSEAERDSLVDELATALDEMVRKSCAEMAPLWIRATRQARTGLGDAQVTELGFAPSQRYLALSKGARSRYAQLAAWRHAVLWQAILRDLDDPDHAEAVQTVYFTPYPHDAPPYAWSQRVSDAPGIERFPSPSTLKNWSKEGCWRSVALLRALRRRLLDDGSWGAELRADLLKAGCRDSLRDVLKLDDFDENWEAQP